MRHHEPLIAMRKAGRKPAGMVYLEMDGYCPSWSEWPQETPERPRIHIEASDAIQHLDLRFVVGLNVSIDSTDQWRLHELFAAAQDHGAARVIASVMRKKGDGFEHVEILDTLGVLTWN